jgi:hypothetical protein
MAIERQAIVSRWFDAGRSGLETAVVLPEASNLAGWDNNCRYIDVHAC